MTTLNYLLLAVDSPLKSAELYSQMLATQPVQKSDGFVLYVLPNGIKIGLWRKDEVEPKPTAPGGIEVSFSEPDNDAVRSTYAAWRKLGLETVQEPTDMDFGFTFVAADPDGHRLRVFALNDNPS